MLGERETEAQNSRLEYLSLPYNDPLRKLVRGMEAYYGELYKAENAAMEATKGLFGSALAGVGSIIGAVGGAIVFGPAGVLAGALVGGAAGAIAGGLISVRVRYMLPSEWGAAARVFGGSLPPIDKIILTDLIGAQNRAFTIPASSIALIGSIVNPTLLAFLVGNPKLFAGRILINIGSAYENPLAHVEAHYSTPGQLLMHELTHAWQIQRSNFVPGFLCEAASTAVQGHAAYDYTVGKQWRDYNIEQQGAIVDGWFGAGARSDHPNYRYIRANILSGSNDADSVPIGTYGAPLILAPALANRPANPFDTSPRSEIANVVGVRRPGPRDVFKLG